MTDANSAATSAPEAIFDGHNDVLLRLERMARLGHQPDFFSEGGGGHLDLPRARRGGFAGGLFAMFTPPSVTDFSLRTSPDDPAFTATPYQPDALAVTLAMAARALRLARDSNGAVTICRSVADIRAAMAAGRLAMVLHVEGAEAIDTEFNALETLHAAGLRSLGPVWSRPNVFGHGAPMAAQPQLEPGEGLTDHGKALIQACDALKIAVDLSHITEKGFWDAAAVTEGPLIASHSNVHAICPSARNLTDRQLDAIAERGGLAGLNFHVAFLREDCRNRSDTPLDVAIRHLDHMLERLGEDGVALGSDFDGCLPPADLGGAAQLPNLVAAMRAAGYGDALVAKICRENWLRVLERVWGG